MGKAWNSGHSKPLALRRVIYRVDDGVMMKYFIEASDGTRHQLPRSEAEHQVCSGAARYVNETQG
jgi:hypothetical protein